MRRDETRGQEKSDDAEPEERTLREMRDVKR